MNYYNVIGVIFAGAFCASLLFMGWAINRLGTAIKNEWGNTPQDN